jgi:hypothetical protein
MFYKERMRYKLNRSKYIEEKSIYFFNILDDNKETRVSNPGCSLLRVFHE